MVPVDNLLRKLKQPALTICFEPVMQTYPSLRAKEGARGHFDPDSKKLCSRLQNACSPKLYF